MVAEPGQLLTEFLANEPVLRPLSRNTGGGFRLQVDVPESEYAKVLDLNNPALKDINLVIRIFTERTS